MSRGVSIVRGTNDKPAASELLAAFFEEQSDLDGQLFLGYPIIPTAEGPHALDATWISPTKGIVIFDLIEGEDPTGYEARQDDAANKLEARLRIHSGLVQRRRLAIEIHAVSFAPRLRYPERVAVEGYPIANLDSLRCVLDSLQWSGSDFRLYELALSVIQNITTIRSARTKRVVRTPGSRGEKLKRLEDSIATLDPGQGSAVLETVDGVQRIRGLAGSGKTIVLALKAAYLHAQHPDWHIAVTFRTRSLKGYFRRLITNFSVEQTGEEPDWSRLRIVNAWGAPGGDERDGIYYTFCRVHGIQYHDFLSARQLFPSEQEFAGVCESALSQVEEFIPQFDVILVDEAQDFPPVFLRLCYELLRPPKRLVYAYDELQNLSGESLPPPEEIFGKEKDGTPRVTFGGRSAGGPEQDIILSRCYRNSRPVLVTAHALGFGIYREPPEGRETGLVQMFDHPQLWEDIGYRCFEGRLEEGQEVTLGRPPETSPRFLEEHSSIDDLVQFIQFASEEDQAEWVAESIRKNLMEDELRHEDIIVINPNPRTTITKVGPIRRRLLEMGIQSHTAGVDTDPDVFYKDGAQSITFTGIHRAKGSEAGMVYIINAQDCDSSSWNLASLRNRLFTAITRSKAWVRVLGVGERMEKLIDEFEKVKAADFTLRFTYPTAAQRKYLKIVHRDMSDDVRRDLQRHHESLTQLLHDIASGRLHFEDLDEKIRNDLKALVNKRD